MDPTDLKDLKKFAVEEGPLSQWKLAAEYLEAVVANTGFNFDY